MAELVAGPVADSLVQSVIGAVKKEVKYVQEYKTYVKNLKEGLADLEGARDQVQHAVDKALDNAEKIENAVTTWINEVDNATEVARDLLKKNEKSKKSCFRGIIPNLSTRFQISKEAEGIIETVTKLKDKRAQLGESISYHGAPLGRVTGTYTGANYHVTKSRADLLKEINKVLMDSTVRIVGVSGPSGVGKSVLMKQVEKQVSEKKLGYNFQQVTIVTVGQAPNLEKIQDETAYRLGLKFENENGVEQKAHRLSERLKQKKKTLMIFDDLWKKLDLDKLGIPQGDDYSHIKILLTSRSKEMLTKDMNSKPNLTLEPLEKEEALELFEKLAGHHIKDESMKELLKKQLTEGCAGLPVFIVPLATKLKRLPLSTWNDALKNVKRSDSVGMKKFIEETLGINYQVIQAEEVKALFLLCGQIGNQIIHIDDLLIYGMGIGFLKGDSIEECRERLQTLLESLKSNGLLEEETSDRIKIHDLVSEVSLSIAKKDHRSLVLRNKKSLDDCSEDELRNCESISFPYVDDIYELREGLICPELNVLLLYTEGCPLNLPNSFFNGMKKLKVLDFSGVVLTVLPSSIELLDELHTLCLDGCKIEDLTNIGKLTQLQMLTFRGSDISRLPKEVGRLIHLRLLNLINCYRLEVIEPDVLGSLIHLEELVLPESFNRWEAEGVINASLNELNNMSCLSSLQIRIPDVNALPHDLPFGNLKRYKILMGDRSDCFMEYDEERTLVLKLNSDDSKIIWEDWVQTTLQRAQKISLLGWGGIEKGVIELSKGGFLELKHIDLHDSPRVQYIFRPNERSQFSFVESLYLYKLMNLEKIHQGSLTRDSFTNLKSLRIKACHKLKNLFSISIAKELLPIEVIEVEDCEIMREILTFDLVDYSLEQKEGTIDNKLEPMAFKKLHTLKLSGLPDILSFCGTAEGNMTTNKGDDSSQVVFFNAQQVSFPSLKSLTLSALPLLEKISDSKSTMKLHRLHILEIEACEKLRNAFDSQLLLQLKSLKQLTIKNCKSMKTIFDLDKLSTSEAAKSPVVPKPMSLMLVDLPSLETIWRMNLKDISLVQNLKQLQVSGCGGLKYLFSPSMAKSLQSITHISISDCKRMEKIFVEEKKDGDDARDTIVFSSLTELSISHMESLTMFASGNRCLEFPCLKQIELRNCPNMSTFVPSKLSRMGTFSKNLKKLSRTTTAQHVDGVRDKYFFSGKAILPSLEKVVLSSMESLTNIWESSLPRNSFCRLASIKIGDCQKLQTIFPLSLMGRLQNLTELEVCNCKALEVLFESGEQDLTISKLKDMSLRQLQKLEQLVMIKGSSKKVVLRFPVLTNIHIDECHGLVELFPNATARTLFELENLEITSCSRMVKVFSTVAEDEESQSLKDMAFSNLCSLKLKYLHNLISFCTGYAKHYFPFLKELSIIGCTKLKAFVQKPPKPTFNEDESTPLFDEKVVFPNLQKLQIQGLSLTEIWHNKLPARFFCKLKFLLAEACNNLSVLIPSFMMNNLQSLDSLTVTKCNSLEVIFELEGHTSKDRKLAKSRSWKLQSIKLSDLPKLKCICKSTFFSENFLFHELVSLEVRSCESMEQVIESRNDSHSRGCKRIVFSHLSSLKLLKLPKLITFCDKRTTELPSLQKLEIGDCNVVEALIADSEQHFKPLFLLEKVAFPKIESLMVSTMSNLKDLWCTSKEGKGSECSSDAFFNLKTLLIKGCDSLSTILSSKVIRGFQNLETLWVANCNSLEQVFQVQGNKVDSNDNAEVISIDFSLRDLRLSDLPIMKQIWMIEDPEWVKLSFKKLASVQIVSCDRLGRLFPDSVAKYILEELQDLIIESCESFEHVIENGNDGHIKGCKKIIFSHLSSLTLSELPNLITFCAEHTTEWPSLQELKIRDCNAVEALVADSAQHFKPLFLLEKVAIPKIESLIISKMSNLKDLWCTTKEGKGSECSSDAFFNLKTLQIDDCNSLSTILSSKVIRGFQNLQELSVKNCSSLEQVFQVQGNMVDSNDNAKVISIDFSLRELRLLDLPTMKQIWTIENPEGIKLYFEKLESVEIESCDSLKHLFPVSVAKYLHQLEKVNVSSCNKMKDIVSRERNSTKDYVDGSANGKFISFPKATFLRLEKLPELKSILYGVHSSEWPSLEKFVVFECPNVKILAAEMWNTNIDSNNGNEFNNPSNAQVNPVDKENISSLRSITTDTSGLVDGRFPHDFVNLERIALSKIEDEEAVKRFPWNMLLDTIHNVEVLEISHSSFEELFPSVDEEAHGHAEGEEEEKEIVQLKSGGLTGNGRQKHALGTLKIQSLRKLKLDELHKLKHVWKQDSIMADILNIVERLIIWQCGSLTILFPTSASFLNLTELQIVGCGGMVHLVTASAAGCMVQLIELEIGYCNRMKHIVIEDQDGNGIEGINVGAGISFPRLKVLRLRGLGKLESFSSTNFHFNFPSLEFVDLQWLHALEDFCKGGFTAPILHHVFTWVVPHAVAQIIRKNVCISTNTP